MKIGLLGFGVVGRGVYDITAKMEDIQIAKVVCLEDDLSSVLGKKLILSHSDPSPFCAF